VVEENTHRIAPDELRERLAYDPETGMLTWASKPPKADGKPNNRIRVGAEAGWVDTTTGYRRLSLCHTFVYAHHAVWALCTGDWPSEQIDHINHDKLDNRISNLRLAPQAANTKNTSIRSNNTSGVNGVSFNRKNGLWYAYIRSEGRTYNLGHYAVLGDAASARKDAERRFGFHENHGLTTTEIGKQE